MFFTTIIIRLWKFYVNLWSSQFFSYQSCNDSLNYFCCSFSESVQLLPPGLTLTIWKQFHQAFSQTYLPQLNQTSSTISSPSPSKKRKKVKEIAKEVNIEPLSRTFHLYLRSMRLVDASLTAPLLKRVEVVMNEMKGDILELLLDTSRKSKVIIFVLILYIFW